MVSPRAKKFILGSAVFGMLFGTPSCADNQNNGKDKKSPKTEVPAKKKKQKPGFSKKYKIKTRADFDQLYADAEPFIFAAMIPTENWRTDFHNDRQKSNAVPNSVGVGLFYVGVKNGALDFNSLTWKKTKSYVISYRRSHNGKNPPSLKPYQLYEGTRGWFKNMDSGRHLNELFSHLKGAELTINEFAAIASIYYNDEAIGKQVCNYVKTNYKNPKKCAQYILSTRIKLPGIKPRRVHEVLMYLNHNNYCVNVFGLEVDGHLGTSVSGLGGHFDALKKGITNAKLDAAANTIYTRAVKNGRSIKYYVQLMNNHQDAVLAFAGQTAQTIEMDERGELYARAMTLYNAADYAGALKLFKQIVAENGNSADLHNDMAITYYHLGEYKQCIEQCQKALNTGEREKYMYATYNAGLAYWALKDYDGAIRNFKSAIKYATEFGEDDNRSVYEKKLAACEEAKKDNGATKTIKPANKKTPASGTKKPVQKKGTKSTNKKKATKNMKNGTRKVRAMIELDKLRRQGLVTPRGKEYA